MKITFTFWQVIGILILTLICYLIFPWFYNSWIFPEYNTLGHIKEDDILARFSSIVFGIVLLLIYLGPIVVNKKLLKEHRAKIVQQDCGC